MHQLEILQSQESFALLHQTSAVLIPQQHLFNVFEGSRCTRVQKNACIFDKSDSYSLQDFGKLCSLQLNVLLQGESTI